MRTEHSKKLICIIFNINFLEGTAPMLPLSPVAIYAQQLLFRVGLLVLHICGPQAAASRRGGQGARGPSTMAFVSVPIGLGRSRAVPLKAPRPVLAPEAARGPLP